MEIVIQVNYHKKKDDTYYIEADFQNLKDARILYMYQNLPSVDVMYLPTGIVITGLKPTVAS